MKSNKKQNLTSKTLLVSLAIVLLVIQTFFIAKLWLENQSTNKNLALISLRQLNNPNESHPIVDAAAKKLYLPGLNLYLPLSIDVIDLNYRVADPHGGGTTDLVFSTNNYEDTIGADQDSNDICSYLVRAEIGADEAKPRAGEVSQNPFKLNDGRMVYSYLPERKSTCSQFQY